MTAQEVLFDSELEADAQRWAARQTRDRAVRVRAEEIIQSLQGGAPVYSSGQFLEDAFEGELQGNKHETPSVEALASRAMMGQRITGQGLS